MVFHQLSSWPNESIYDGNRLALPDEVVNFQRGDGLEKAVTLINIIKSRHIKYNIEQRNEKLVISGLDKKFEFQMFKSLKIPSF